MGVPQTSGLKPGQVMSGNGSFALSDMRMQSHYHPDAK
tara:strand:- start:186449 stop:186562 length:114 start_codon:yes stop_codon:yes gene_type:complete